MSRPNEASQEIVGKTIARVEYDYNGSLNIHFTDGSMLYVQGTWHNDSTAGTDVSLLAPDDPKSYHETHDFYQLASDRRWADD